MGYGNGVVDWGGDSGLSASLGRADAEAENAREWQLYAKKMTAKCKEALLQRDAWMLTCETIQKRNASHMSKNDVLKLYKQKKENLMTQR